MEFLSLALGRVERRRRAADINEGQPTGIAVRQHLHSATDQLCAMPSDVSTMPHILISKFLRCGQRKRLLLGDGLAGLHRRAYLVHRRDRVEGSWPCTFQSLVDLLYVALKF